MPTAGVSLSVLIKCDQDNKLSTVTVSEAEWAREHHGMPGSAQTGTRATCKLYPGPGDHHDMPHTQLSTVGP
eukprot:2971656-Rhodomonas_salina.1